MLLLMVLAVNPVNTIPLTCEVAVTVWLFSKLKMVLFEMVCKLLVGAQIPLIEALVMVLVLVLLAYKLLMLLFVILVAPLLDKMPIMVLVAWVGNHNPETVLLLTT